MQKLQPVSMITEKRFFSNINSMADRLANCHAKECSNSLRKMQKIRTQKKAVRPGLLFGQHGLMKKGTVRTVSYSAN